MKFYMFLVVLIAKALGLKKRKQYSCDTEETYNEVPYVLAGLLVAWGITRFCFGMGLANDPQACRVRSIGDIVIAPAYTLGCNVGKNRFDWKLN